MKRRYEIAGLAGLVACRFGGPTADPAAYVAFPDAAGNGGVDAAYVADDGGSPASPVDATTVPSGGDANRDDAPGGDASADDTPNGETTDAGACSGTVAVCNPVRNTGCNALQQCDVDPSQATTPTGLCVFGSAAEGGPCLSTIFTESCPPQFTCVSGGCRELCFCDADCPAGQCCSDPSGPPGFTLCRPCP
jgi:hypothetical protein